jgi:hypothetical protein
MSVVRRGVAGRKAGIPDVIVQEYSMILVILMIPIITATLRRRDAEVITTTKCTKRTKLDFVPVVFSWFDPSASPRAREKRSHKNH